MTKPKVDKGIPIPNRGGRRDDEFPWLQLHVGDSFAVPWNERHRIANTYDVGRRHGRTFTVRKMPDNTVRVWRTE